MSQTEETKTPKVVITAAVPPELVKKLDEASEKAVRSRAAEIQVRLQKSFDAEEK